MAGFAGISPSDAVHQDVMRAPSEKDIDALYEAIRFDAAAADTQPVQGMRLQSVNLSLQASVCLMN